MAVFCRAAGQSVERSLDTAVKSGCRSIISFGIAGGLSPDLRPGDWIVASAIATAQGSYATDLALSRKLLEAVPGAEYAPIAGVDSPLLDPASKQEFHRAGAAAVDMESHLVARLAAAHGLTFAAVRVVVDPAHRVIPTAVVTGLRPNGSADTRAVLRELLKSPREVPLLARLALDALTARNALARTRRTLGPGLGLLGPDPDGPALRDEAEDQVLYP